MTDIYRQAASILLLRKAKGDTGEPYQLLLLHKPRRRDAWQLPQGGIEEGENVEQAALRELFEEAGIQGVSVLGKSEKCYKYDFPASYRRFRPDNVCGQCISYIYAMAPSDASIRVDEKEIDNHVWIYPSELKRYLKRKPYLTLVEELLQEGVSLAEG
ncbi:MAG: NUDIX domain-containing protein [Candidatus Peregrinibacteria bacterium]|nr:NUDIX domain-containing protein [Candidatus Peregrinibacteria bacterium]